MDKKELIKILHNDIKSYLSPFGFKGGRNGYKKTSNNVIYKISFGISGSNSDFVEVNPVVGSMDKNAEDVLYLTDLDHINNPQYKYITAHISSPLGYLMPQNQFKTWNFNIDKSNYDVVLKDMISNINLYGLPTLDKWSSTQSILEGMVDGYGIRAQTLYTIPIYYYLIGQKDEALKYLSLKLEEKKDKKILGFEEFVNNLINYINKN